MLIQGTLTYHNKINTELRWLSD